MYNVCMLFFSMGYKPNEQQWCYSSDQSLSTSLKCSLQEHIPQFIFVYASKFIEIYHFLKIYTPSAAWLKMNP